MRKVSIIIALLLLCSLSSCDKVRKLINSDKTPEEIFEESRSGVVVVLNKYYYTLKLPNDKLLYFTGLDKDGEIENLTANKDEIIKKKNMITGTAFFISDDGKLLTNRHVVEPTIDKAKVKSSYRNIVKTMQKTLDIQMGEYISQYNALEAQKQTCYSYDYWGNRVCDYNRMSEIEMQQSEIKTNYQELEQSRSQLDNITDTEELNIDIYCEIGIAYDNTFVTTDKDFIDQNPCVVVSTSDKEDVDLALIQLKSKKTPETSAIFEFYDGEEDLKINEQLCMIGYNAGLILANTKQGIKAQITTGQVTQQPDGQRLLYSIPTLQGSSGSPVVNLKGKVVAVNFAKLVGTDNFNFGIPNKQIKKFLEE